MEKGYYLVEPSIISPLIKGASRNDQLYVMVAVLNWIAEQIMIDLKDQLDGAEVEVIKVTWMGSYPALGIYAPNPDPSDKPFTRKKIEILVENHIQKLLEQHSIAELLQWMRKTDWKAETEKLMDNEAPLL